MVVGDVSTLTGTQACAQGATTYISIQPPAGETWKILGVLTQAYTNSQTVGIEMYNGSAQIDCYMTGDSNGALAIGSFAQSWSAQNYYSYPGHNGLIVDNSIYMRIKIYNNYGSERTYQYCVQAIQIN